MNLCAPPGSARASCSDSSTTLPQHGSGVAPLKIPVESAPCPGRKRLSPGNIKRNKALRRKLFNGDDENTSPVLGIRIIPAREPKVGSSVSSSLGTANGANFTCKLCKMAYGDPVQLASHRCARIQNVQYECPECGKSFSCPANLASHRRWHKPKKNATTKSRNSVDCKLKSDLSTAAEHADESVEGQNPLLSKEAKNLDTSERLPHGTSVSGMRFKREPCWKQHVIEIHDVEKRLPGTMDRKDNSISGGLFRAKQPISKHCDFGGLAALALAAELHSRLSPDFISTDKFDACKSQRCNRKRHSSPSCEYTPTMKAMKSNPATEKIAAKKSVSHVWLPPSPPRSDLSCSPHSATSDENDEKTSRNSLIANFCRPNNDPVQIPGLDARLTKVAVNSAAQITQQNNLAQKFSADSVHAIHIPRYLPVRSIHSISKFQEPFHPFVYSLPNTNPGQSLPNWNSWAAHASTAWKSTPSFPFFYQA